MDRPDDAEANAALESAESFGDAIFELAAKYDIPLTNNYARWQDGQWLREIGDFATDVESIARRFL